MIHRVEGELTRQTCSHQIEVAQIAIESGARQMDLSQVERVDSTALAYWFALRRFSSSRAIELNWSGYPQQMLSIAQLVGVAELIGGKSQF